MNDEKSRDSQCTDLDGGKYRMWNNFLISLAIMGKGMAGIFVVVLIITAVVLILGKLK